MSTGMNLIASLVADGTRNGLREVDRNWLLDEEKPAYDFVVRFTREHGRLPSRETCLENGLELPRQREPFSYYLERVRVRAEFNVISALHGPFYSAMEQKNMVEVQNGLRRMLAESNAINRHRLVTTIGREAQIIAEEMSHGAFIETRGITTGYPVLDGFTGGIDSGDLMAYAGRPNVGKSYFLLNSMLKGWQGITDPMGVPMRQSSPLVVTMEMKVRQLTNRLIGLSSGINPRFIRDNRLSTWSRDDIYETVSGFQLLPPLTFLSGHSIQNISDIELVIQETRPDCVYIDAAYLLKPTTRMGQGKRWEVMSEAVEELKGVADRTDVPMMITLQLRKPESRSKKNPQETSLDEVGGTDAFAQQVSILVNIEQPIGINSQTRRKHTLAKNREGPKMQSWHTRFEFSPMNFDHVLTAEVEARNTLMRSMI